MLAAALVTLALLAPAGVLSVPQVLPPPTSTYSPLPPFPTVTSPPGACGPTPSDPGCTALVLACVARRDAATSVLTSDVCIAAATCYPTGVDQFLFAVSCRVRGPSGNVPVSATLPRLSDQIISRIAGGIRGFVSLRTYSAWYVAQAQAAGGPVPHPQYVADNYKRIAAWTGFCRTLVIPYSNLIDWFQWSSSVQGPATTCTVSCPPSADASCQVLVDSCLIGSNGLTNPYSSLNCVLAATCAGVSNFAGAAGCAFGAATSPNPRNFPRLEPRVFGQISGEGRGPFTTFNQQRYIDAYYGALSGLNSDVWPPNVSTVINNFQRIAQWTAFPTNIPYANFADWLNYS